MIELEDCVKWLKNGSFKKVCLQIPDNFKTDSVTIVSYLQKNADVSAYIIGDVIYENCCSDRLSIDHSQADAIIHFGHACLSCRSDLPTFYVFPKEHLDINVFYDEFRKYFDDETKNILFFYDVSYAHIIENIYEKLKTKYRNLIISKMNCTSNVAFVSSFSENSNSTVLGRNYELPTNRQLESYDAIFLGPDNKTLMTLSMSIPVKAWHYFDDLKFNEYNILSSSWFKRRRFLVEKIKDAHTFGIIIASLNTDNYLKITDMLKEILKKVKKKSYLFSFGKLNPTKLANFQEVDIFVAVACPESSLIDSRDYYKPIVTPFEVDLAFNDARSFSIPYTIDFQEMLPGGSNHQPVQIISKTDVSLTSGKMRSISDDNVERDNNTLVQKSSGAMINNENYTNFLQSKSWAGLEQQLGQNSVELAVDGRDGLPLNYKNELD